MDSLRAELASLVAEGDLSFLLTELDRVRPPHRLRELAEFDAQQAEDGGGFYGLMPPQMTNREAIPAPLNETGRLRAAVYLARQRQENLASMRKLNPEYASSFRGTEIPDWGNPESSAIRVRVDFRAIEGFLEALDDSVSTLEAGELVALASNREMLRHRTALSYMPEPKATSSTLADMIARAGSGDPLERLWCWVNPWNHFGYADLVMQTDAYRQVTSELQKHAGRLEREVSSRVSKYAPEDAVLDEQFALTVGWGIRGWATEVMAGLNFEQVKDDWDLLLGTMIEETYHRLQLRICPTVMGDTARTFEDLAAADLSDQRFNGFYELLTYMVLEGTATLTREAQAAEKPNAGVEDGIALLSQFVETVIDSGRTERADELIGEGLRSNGPLYSLGRALARPVAEREGPRAVGTLLTRGPVAFVLHAQDLTDSTEAAKLPARVMVAIRSLEGRIRDRGASE